MSDLQETVMQTVKKKFPRKWFEATEIATPLRIRPSSVGMVMIALERRGLIECGWTEGTSHRKRRYRRKQAQT